MSMSKPGPFGLLRPGKSKLLPSRPFNAAGSAGPRRLAVVGLFAATTAGVVATIVLTGNTAPPESRDARLANIDPLPGGLHTTPAQNALSVVSTDRQARSAMQKGASYTPPMAPSQPAKPPPPPPAPEADAAPAPPAGPVFVGRPVKPAAPSRPVSAMTPAVSSPAPRAFPMSIPTTEPSSSMRATPVAATGAETQAQAQAQAQAQQAYSKQIGDMFSQWGGRPPRTDVVLPPQQNAEEGDASTPASGAYVPRQRAVAPAPQPVSARSGGERGRVLIPAGRGVFAHPVLALSSDQTSPVVLQADSGPIAGDRMIGTFSKEANRLIIHVSSIIHNGENIGCDGVVTAPDTMEAGVASKVDEHYIARFVLPAAAAFVQGLGAAIATTSNTTAVLSPLGGATTSTHLNIPQQLGIAAGTASQQLGSTLNQEAPKGPTISLEANVAVGVMFLSNVTSQREGR